MTIHRQLTILCFGSFLLTAQPALADTPNVSRTVDSSGVPVISIHGKAQTNATPLAKPVIVAAPQKEFKVYELDGQGTPHININPTPQIVVISSPPPIPANPAAFNYGYYGGYGFGYPCNGGFWP